MQPQQTITGMRHAWIERSAALETPARPQAEEQAWMPVARPPLQNANNDLLPTDLGLQLSDNRMFAQQLKQANARLAQRDRELSFALAQLDASKRQLKAAQLKLIQVEKMQCVGCVAAGVAHEVKNPLAIISLGTEYLLGHPGADDSASATILRRMQEAAGRAEHLLRGLVDFSAPGRLETTVASLNQVIRQSLSLVQYHLLRSHVRTVIDLDEQLPQLRLDIGKMEQVFINLVLNAVQAMPEGGRLTIRTRAQGNLRGNGRQPLAAGGAAAMPGGCIVEIEDTGPGIPPQKLAHVFEPFFTTKAPGQGSGLGLPVCKSIVELHGGTIQVANRKAGGARVTIRLKGGSHDRSKNTSLSC